MLTKQACSSRTGHAHIDPRSFLHCSRCARSLLQWPRASVPHYDPSVRLAGGYCQGFESGFLLVRNTRQILQCVYGNPNFFVREVLLTWNKFAERNHRQIYRKLKTRLDDRYIPKLG